MKRIITGMIAGIAWLLLLFSGSFLLVGVVVAVIGIAAMHEYSAIIANSSGNKWEAAFIAFAVLPLLAALSGKLAMVTASLFVAFILIITVVFKRYASIGNPYEHMAKLALGLVFIGFSGAHFTMIMALPEGNLWLLLLTAITVVSDSSAFYTGTLIGRNKLCPAISPGKTVEGFIGGLVGGTVAALLVAVYFLPAFTLWKIGVAAALLCCIGVVGDLTESIIKRAAGVKDSGDILPGHGGILDRIDSLLLTAPVLYYLLCFNIVGTVVVK